MKHGNSDDTPPAWLASFKLELSLCQQTIRMLNGKSNVRKKINWHILIGPISCGKSSLLKTLNCQRIQSNEESNVQSPFNLWVNQTDGFLVADLETLETKTHNNCCWQNVLPLIKKVGLGQRPLKVIIAIDVPSLTLKSLADIEKNYQSLKNQLIQLHTVLSKITLHITINQCDRIIGMRDYSQEKRLVNREKSFGISLKNKDKSIHFDVLFHLRRKKLIQKISSHSLHICQGPITKEKRQRITQLPFQVDQAFLRIKHLINILPDAIKLKTVGIQLLSSQQRYEPINITLPFLKQIISPVHYGSESISESYRPLFIQQKNFLRMITRERKSRIKQLNFSINLNPVIISVLAGLSFITLYHTLLSHGYQTSANVYDSLNSVYSEYQENHSSTQLSWLEILDKDQDMLNVIDQSGVLNYRWLGMNTMSDFYHQVHRQFHDIQQGKLIPYCYGILIKSVTDPKQNKPMELFDNLNVFLMMTGSIPLNQHKVIDWYESQWSQLGLDKKAVSLASQQLNLLLKNNFQAWPTNISLVKKIQLRLSKYPLSQLALLKLASTTLNHDVTVAPVEPSILTKESLTLNSFYTNQQKKRILKLTEKQLIDLLQSQNDIIKTEISSPNSQKIPLILKEIQSTYLSNYQQVWQSLLINLKFKVPTSLENLNNLNQQLTNFNSDFYNTINTIQINANQSQLNINELKNDSEDNEQQWRNTLLSMQTVIDSILKAEQPDLAAFEYSTRSIHEKKQEPSLLSLKTEVESAPDLLQPALDIIVKNYWGCMLGNSKKYINQQWYQKILPLYNSTIKDKFPVFSGTSTDITIAHFNDFFGPKGAIDDFFNQYLSPFVNASGYYWTWKKIDGHTLSNSQHALDMIIRASVIQQMFYANNSDYPSQELALVLKKYPDNMKDLEFTIDDKTFKIKPASAEVYKINVINKEKQAASLKINGKSGEDTINTSGFWPWLRLVNQGEIKTTSDSNQFFLAFKTEHYLTEFGLIAKNKQNPYLPNILSAFRCPDNF